MYNETEGLTGIGPDICPIYRWRMKLRVSIARNTEVGRRRIERALVPDSHRELGGSKEGTWGA
jgi:hypothetical protein